MKIIYRLGNVLNGGKNKGTSKWSYILTNFPDSLGAKYIKLNKHKIKFLVKIINQYDIILPRQNECIVHLRLGDVLDKSKYSVEQHFKKSIPSTGCINANIILPQRYYKKSINRIKKYYKFIDKIKIITCFHNSTDNSKSKQYLNVIEQIFSKSFETETIINSNNCYTNIKNYKNVDLDFVYMSNSKYFIKSIGSYSNWICKVIQYKKGHII